MPKIEKDSYCLSGRAMDANLKAVKDQSLLVPNVQIEDA